MSIRATSLNASQKQPPKTTMGDNLGDSSSVLKPKGSRLRYGRGGLFSIWLILVLAVDLLSHNKIKKLKLKD